jgi:hypothetical protein
VVTPGQARLATDHLQERFGVSQRRTCRVLDRARSTVRYQAQPRDGQAELVREINRLAGRFPRYGYKAQTQQSCYQGQIEVPTFRTLGKGRSKRGRI